MVGELADQPPLLVRKLRTGCAPARRLLALAHRGEFQREDAPKLVLGIGVISNKRIGALSEHAAKIDSRCRKPQHATIKQASAAAIRLFPDLLPQIAQNSRTRFFGGARPPATLAKIAASSAVSGDPNAAASTASQVDQLDASPSAAPSS